MTYDDAMEQMKLGRAVRREGWQGHVRVEGLRIVRVKPNVRPAKFHATAADRAATDWVASAPPTTSALVPQDVSDFLNHGPDWAVDASAGRS